MGSTRCYAISSGLRVTYSLSVRFFFSFLYVLDYITMTRHAQPTVHTTPYPARHSIFLIDHLTLLSLSSTSHCPPRMHASSSNSVIISGHSSNTRLPVPLFIPPQQTRPWP